MKQSLTLFPAPGTDGRRLAEAMIDLAGSVGFACRLETEYSLRTGMRAELCDDVAIYDLSTDGKSDGAYRALSALYTFFEHVLIVSRTPLPFNVLPARAGGAPPYPYPVQRLPDGRAVRLPRFSLDGGNAEDWIGAENRSLLSWLRQELEDLHSNPRSPRLYREASFDPMWPYSREIQQLVADLGKPGPSGRPRPTRCSSATAVHTTSVFWTFP